MKTFEQDYKTTIRVAFSDMDKAHAVTKDFWCESHTKQDMVQSICRAFHYEKASWSKDLSNWVKFLEGQGSFTRTDAYRGEGDVYRHMSEEHGIIEVWYELEFEEDFRVSEVTDTILI